MTLIPRSRAGSAEAGGGRIGWLLLLDGVAVEASFLQALLAPGYPTIRRPTWAIGFVAEVGFALWLVIKGVPPEEPPTDQSSESTIER